MQRRTFLTALGATAAFLPGARAQSQPVRIGIVGGRFGATFQWHLHPNARVEAVCDISKPRLDTLSEVYRCGNRYEDFRRMLQHPGLDAVGVFTPAPLHVWMAETAINAGKHVISAVPAGLSIEELERLLEAVERTGMRYMMAETSYYRPEVVTCREMAERGEFGTIVYSEAEYHHEGLLELMFDDRRLPTWRHGFPPMWYPTHCTGMIVPVTGERLRAVSAIGWGDDHEVCRTNAYHNPFWNTTGLFETERGKASRVTVAWHLAAGGTERGQFYGDRASFLMDRPEGSPDTLVRIARNGQTSIDANGYPEGKVEQQEALQRDYLERLPEPMRVPSGHGGSHTHLTHEFIQAIAEDRHPAVNVWEAIAYTAPGLVAHESALAGGERMQIPDFGRAPA
ncbi:MAG: gfo/Idh/MocA family oxidoreductase [Acidobacteria bacterium]|nr:gfo/Idh/MocA family oxidoreductase [Acidobacteriota bacterium]